ncbi:hypothetical protein P608_05940 [Comamonas thiooxydans]|uniref:Uncharacterized protein n=1 Tax=Comamonas thiooxydans TaxID=363952 RepID=A0A0E3C0Z1_9BURK|nr:hypothetical protein P609_22585 [Comamonas thiooxydans]KGG92335.1 hypothetical protein P245_11870 [Comamonas thiooxydans]KGG93595.1 hypothetical protein P369_07855 [Comamonas thiooxydans]KGG98839.1 hypothetical protein P367_10830 [Comamonas thiooxydans]KGH17085.1 hypothetical protein P608_05940 [Comamonas thiooxydans]
MLMFSAAGMHVQNEERPAKAGQWQGFSWA